MAYKSPLVRNLQATVVKTAAFNADIRDYIWAMHPDRWKLIGLDSDYHRIATIDGVTRSWFILGHRLVVDKRIPYEQCLFIHPRDLPFAE